MEFFELMEKRRSVRDYEDKPVPLNLIQEMIDDGIKAPNAGNMQLWRFVVVNNKGVLKRISDQNKEAFLADIEQNEKSGWKVYEKAFRNPDYNVFYNASSALFVVGSAKARTLPLDASLFAAYFMLSAAARGLGTCWVAQGAAISDPAILEELGIPENYQIISAIIVGYPKSVPAMPDRKAAKILKVIESE
jgi:nitroreductase